MEKKAIAYRMSGKKSKTRKPSKPGRGTVVMSAQNLLGGPMAMGTK